MDKVFNNIYSAKKNYFASGMALGITAFGYAVLRLLGSLGMYNGMSDGVADIVGSLLVQVVLMLGVSVTVNLTNEYNKPRFKFMQLSGSIGIAVDEGDKTDASSPIKHHLGKIGDSFKSIGFSMPPKYMFPLSILLGILFIFFTVGVSMISVIVLTMLGYNFGSVSSDVTSTSAGMFVLALFLSAVLPAICEEILHRGVMVKGLKESMSEEKVVLLTAIIFGLAHAYIGQTLYTFAGGILLAIVTVKSRSLYPAMIIHFINNGFSVYMEHAKIGGWWGYAQYNAAYTWLIDNMLMAIVLWLLCVAVIVLIMRALWLSGDGKDSKRHAPMLIRYDVNTSPYIPNPNEAVKMDTTPVRPKYRPMLLEKIPLLTGMFLLGLMTVFSFVWGLF